MIILQTLLGLVIVYLMFCSCISWSGQFECETNPFIQFSLVIGVITITLVIIIVVLYFSYMIGSIIFHK